MKQAKSTEARVAEVVEFRKKFKELGMNSEDEGVKTLIEKMNEFVRNGTGFSDRIQLLNYERVAICKLTTKKNCVSAIVLRQI